METKRTYGDGCGVARALDLVGERWALLVVRELVLGPKRFTDLQRGLFNASPNVLSQRLRGSPPTATDKPRLYRYLLRHGFPPGLIRSVLLRRGDTPPSDDD